VRKAAPTSPAALVPMLRIAKSSDYPAPVKVAIQGSTGSIGCSALEVIKAHPDRFQVFALSAGNNIPRLISQAQEFCPRFISCQSKDAVAQVRAALGSGVEVLFGDSALSDIAVMPEYDVLLAAVVGVVGMQPVVAALSSGKRVALANKEALVSGGRFVAEAIQSGGGTLLPVDSEHSAIFQALQGESLDDVASIILTASGGPFLNLQPSKLAEVTPEQAIRHPRWNMGAKISIDSATLMNKALELIEAAWLFGLTENQIEVLVHPQSIVHSLVRFCDGSELAQLSVPDMRGAIGYALSYPYGRLSGLMPKLNLAELGQLTFAPLDCERFPAVNLARNAMRAGGIGSAVLNLGNEIAVSNFIAGRLRFDMIVPFSEHTLAQFGDRTVTSFAGLLDLIAEVRQKESELLEAFN
jgi:1-deoxy-D-xylulose-5-phosphate reductoisomerase